MVSERKQMMARKPWSLWIGIIPGAVLGFLAGIGLMALMVSLELPQDAAVRVQMRTAVPLIFLGGYWAHWQSMPETRPRVLSSSAILVIGAQLSRLSMERLSASSFTCCLGYQVFRFLRNRHSACSWSGLHSGRLSLRGCVIFSSASYLPDVSVLSYNE